MSWTSFRKGLQTVHLWAGLILSIPFILLGLSGSVLLLQPEVPRLSIPYAPALGKHQSIAAIVEAASKAAPAGTVATRIGLPQRIGEPASVRFAQPRYRGQNVGGENFYIDPVSLKVLGSGIQNRPANIFQFARTLHATLFLDILSGRSVVGWTGVLWTLMMLSGLVLWWPKKGQLAASLALKRGTRGFRWHRDLHSVFGFWTLLLLFIIGVSGIYLAFPQSVRGGLENVLPLSQNFVDATGGAAKAGPSGPPLTLDEAAALAESSVPGAKTIAVQPSLRPGDVVILTLAPTAYGVGAPTILVTVDAKARRLAYIDDPRTYSLGERLLLWQRQLHSGLGLGIVYRVLVFASGFLPLLFGITGLRMWQLKRDQRRAVPAEIAPVPAE